MTNLELMDQIIAYRKKDQTFQRSIDERSEKMPFRFFDGPPFASGTPHYGHLLAGAIKDAIPRYMTMRGYRVERKRGRDCHGLPVEKAVEKDLGIDGKREIETKIGIESFVEKCRAYVNETNDVRKRFINHTARRADIENDYRTMDLDFMESVMYCFDKIYKANLVYKGFKVQRYCPSCATPLANNEVSEGYEDKTDNAITVKFQINPQKSELEKWHTYQHTTDGAIRYVRGVIKNEKGEILQIFSTRKHLFTFPGGKVEEGETLQEALSREINEELGLTVKKADFLGSFKTILNDNPGFREQNLFEVEVSGELINREPEKHSQIKRVKIEASENSENTLNAQLVMDGVIIDTAEEIEKQFEDLYFYMRGIPQKVASSGDAKLFFLARTTTPWTLPSNMFLAAGADILYAIVYDFASQEYFVLAENLLKKYYKNPEDYILIRTVKGAKLAGFFYHPLFDYIQKSDIKAEFKDKFFQILNAEYVSTEDGTGIVHIAPTFGEEDYNVVAQLLGGENALKWLFMPVNEYGEFDKQIPDYEGQSVLTINKTIIERMKEEKKLIKSESITHSYPHCRRCHTPLISKAMSSRFIKEKEMNAQTRKDAEHINFVPESVKNRFVNGLQQAPDRNVARNRYRGSPLPIWQNVDNENDHISVGSLEELYQLSLSGSKNITKHILIRHGVTDYNQQGLHDMLSKAKLNEKGQQQAQEIADKLRASNLKKENTVIVLSPLDRTWETVIPALDLFYSAEEKEKIAQSYKQVQQKYLTLCNEGTLIQYLGDEKAENHFQIGENIYVDFRITDSITPSFQDKRLPDTDRETPLTEKIYGDPAGETYQQRIQRNQNYLHFVNTTYPTRTIITISHGGSLTVHKQGFLNFDYKDRTRYVPKNGEVTVLYRDTTRNTSVDLHKPYVDTYRFMKEGKTYKRIPEVMDCRFESGAMPFGQEHYIGNSKESGQGEKQSSRFTADFIAEGLDQTRGRFRSLHILNHAITGNNAAKNIVVNGLILAEDGKKMSKSLRNYPDPQALIEKRGGDSFRLYCLQSPVVRAEPMKFNEKSVEQIFKDVTIPLQNVYNFFETYAKIDGWKSEGTEVYLRKGSSDAESSTENLEMKTRINPDATVTLSNPTEYANILSENKGKRILIQTDEQTFAKLRAEIYAGSNTEKALVQRDAPIELPTYQITNDLDRRILAELHQTMKTVDTNLQKYILDEATKAAVDFLDKLTNRRLRRSRRRFRANGMTDDKYSAFATLFWVFKRYLQILAPFAPFITEDLWLKLHDFISPAGTNEKGTVQSIHLSYRPFASDLYINRDLISEIATVRKIIKLALFVRAKNKIAVKQPLQSLQVKLN